MYVVHYWDETPDPITHIRHIENIRSSYVAVNEQLADRLRNELAAAGYKTCIEFASIVEEHWPREFAPPVMLELSDCIDD